VPCDCCLLLFLLPLRWAGSDRVVVYWVTPVNPDADAETEMDYRPPRRSLAADWRRKEMGGIARERERERRERTCHLRRSNDQCNSAGIERTPTFSPTVEGPCHCSFAIAFLTPVCIVSFFLEEEGLALLFSVDLFVFDSLCLSTGNSIYSCFLLH
jgi:hypothetical protein